MQQRAMFACSSVLTQRLEIHSADAGQTPDQQHSSLVFILEDAKALVQYRGVQDMTCGQAYD